MAAPVPMNGANAAIQLFVNGAPVSGVQSNCTSWSWKENSTDHTDNYIGNDTHEYDKTLNGFMVEMECDVISNDLTQRLLDLDLQRRRRQLVSDVAIGITFEHRTDGVSGLVWSGKGPGRPPTIKMEQGAKQRDGRITTKLTVMAPIMQVQSL